MAGARPLFSPHDAYASKSSSSAAAAANNDPTAVDADADANADADAEVTVFRVLLPQDFSDADAMRLYAAVAPLRRTIAAVQVRVETLGGGASSSADDDGGEHVAIVTGPALPTRRIEASSSTGKPLELSPVQEALVAVIESGGVHRFDEERGLECVTCLVLVEAERLEAAFGRGILGAIAMEAGAELRVSPSPWSVDEVAYGQPRDEVIEITGDGTSVRRALVAVSSCLQGYGPLGSLTASAHTESPIPAKTSPEVPEPDLGSFDSLVLTESINSSITHTGCPQGVTGVVQTEAPQQLSFRLLCPMNLAGGLIGNKGMVVKKIEVETGASVDVSTPRSGCMERVITISALENPGQQFSIVHSALLRIFDRMHKVESNGCSMFDKPSQCTARVLVLKGQFGCLVGLGGAIIKDMTKITKTRIKILDESDVPACASQYELVLQITGELVNVRDALSLVSEKLRNHVFLATRSNYNNGHAPSLDIEELTASNHGNISPTDQYSTDSISRVDRELSLNEIDSVQNSIGDFHLGYPDSPQLQKPGSASGTETNNPISEVQKPANGNGTGINNSNTGIHDGNGYGIDILNHGITCLEGNKLSRGIETVTVTRITYETAVPGSIFYLVFGDNGNNLTELRMISGADITVPDPLPETGDTMIVISGAPDHAQLALAMLIDSTQQG